MLFKSLIKTAFLAVATLLALQVVLAQDNTTANPTITIPPVVVDPAEDNTTDPVVVADPSVGNNTTDPTLPPVVGCTVGTAAINSDATLIAARAAAVAGVIDLKNPLDCKTKGDKLKCEYDFGDVKSNYETVCQELEGKLIDKNFEIQCKQDGYAGSIIYSFNDAPACIAPSCDESKYYDALVATTDLIATEMNNVTGIKDCDAEISAATTGYHSSHNGLFAVVGSALLALAML